MRLVGATVSMSAVRHNHALNLFNCGEVRSAYLEEKRVADELVARHQAGFVASCYLDVLDGVTPRLAA